MLGSYEKERLFFFEKKKQETFANGVRHWAQRGNTHAAGQRQKFFGSFFQKRTSFLTPPK
jgi:hypothetical protein